MKVLKYEKTIRNVNLFFKIDTENKNIDLSCEEKRLNKGRVFKFNIFHEEAEKSSPIHVKKISITVKIPILDIHGISIPGKVNNPYLFILPWHIEESFSLYKGFPFLSFINRKGENKFAIGIRDPKIGFKISGGIIERTEEFELNISSITEYKGNPIEFEIFISLEREHWFKLTELYSNWVNPKQDRLPDFMYDPVYCSWYAFYQKLNQEHLESVAEEARRLGFKIFILDDGWFTEDTNRGYWYTGDWEIYKGKFSNFKEHVKKIHDIGMKYVLWIAPFMFGKRSKSYEFLSKYSVKSRDSLGFEDLCPQSRFTKQRIVDILKKLLVEYDLDGFKLDFIDDLPTTPCFDDSHEHFTRNPSDGVETILKAIKEELESSINKPIILEFRQQYANPFLKDYSTAFRAADTPFDFDQNRRRIINIRSFSGKFPVYSDPIVWRKGENAENISRHFISCVFGVPMLSMDLIKLTPREKNIIKFWIDFYLENRETLLFGEFFPEFSGGEFTQAFSFSKKEKKLIIALYTTNTLNVNDLLEILNDVKEMYILNGSNDPEVLICGDSLNDTNLYIEILNPEEGLKEYLSCRFSNFLKLKVNIGDIIKIRIKRT